MRVSALTTTISPSLLDLVSAMTSLQPASRPTARQCLAHVHWWSIRRRLAFLLAVDSDLRRTPSLMTAANNHLTPMDVPAETLAQLISQMPDEVAQMVTTCTPCSSLRDLQFNAGETDALLPVHVILTLGTLQDYVEHCILVSSSGVLAHFQLRTMHALHSNGALDSRLLVGVAKLFTSNVEYYSPIKYSRDFICHMQHPFDRD